MAKKLIICTDGTWNPVEDIRPGVRTSTNVAKIAALTAPHDGNSRQLVCYVQGVGTHENDAVSGGAFGWGLSANVEHAYRFLVQNYEPGDQIYLFGFSRGAYTARSVSGLLRNCGIVTSATLVDEALNLYKDRRDDTDPDSIRARVFRSENSHDAKIRFIGVWDTVGALGSPLLRHTLAKALGWDWRFHDASLGPHVQHACHALAIHEERGKFLPTLWAKLPDAPPDQILEQVWFSGCHSNVGGGYSDTSLSDIALQWMIERATAAGLTFEPDWPTKLRAAGQKFQPNHRAPLNSEFKGMYPYMDALRGCPRGVYRQMELIEQSSGAYPPRSGPVGGIPAIIAAIARIRRKAAGVAKSPSGMTGESVHQSVFDRYQEKLPNDWWPPDIEAKLLPQAVL